MASANWWPIDNHTKVVTTHRLSWIGVKKFLVCQVPACTYTHSQYAGMFQMIEIQISNLLNLFVCSWMVSKIKNRNTLWQTLNSLKQCFEETQVNNTPFRLAVPFAVLYTVDIWLIWIFWNFIFSLFPIFPTGPVHTPCKMKFIIWFIPVNFWE